MKKFYLLFITMVVVISINAQTIDWQRTFNDSSITESRAGGLIVTDYTGALYSIGHSNNLNSTGNDILVVKYDSSGNELWSATFNGTANKNEGVFGAAVNSANELLLCGEIFDVSNTNNILVMKYSAAGQVLWIDTVDGSSALYDKGFDLCLDDSNNVYVTGYTFYGSYSAIVLKYDNSGNRLWSKILPSTQQGIGINYHQGFIYITSMTGPTGIPSHASLTKLDPAGNIIWNQPFNYAYSDIIRNTIFDNSNIYLIDEYGSAMGFGSHFGVICMDTSGVINWQRSYSNLYLSETRGLNLSDSLLYISVNEYTDQTYSVSQSVLRGINRFSGDSVFHSAWPTPGIKDITECQYLSPSGHITVLINSTVDTIPTHNRYNLVTYGSDGTYSGTLLLNDVPGFGDCDFEMLSANSFLMQATVYDTVQSTHKLTTWKLNTQPVAVDETEKTFFRIYPNPSHGEIRIENFSPESRSWAITNLNGGVLKRGMCSEKETELNIELKSGIYLFELSNGKKVQREKLVIIK